MELSPTRSTFHLTYVEEPGSPQQIYVNFGSIHICLQNNATSLLMIVKKFFVSFKS